jgi:4-aminobutyrate aminotransferase-like enzyme
MNTQETLDLLRRYESRNITFLDPDGTWPIVWDKAEGVHVWDAEGKQYLDLTAAFGVAAAGHANPKVVRAGKKQMDTLLHAMGDVHPHVLKAQLAQKLSQITFERWTADADNQHHAKTIFCNSGFEAVEAALKTAMLTAGKYGVIAFKGAYHGLGYGTLNATHREHFRGPFSLQLKQFGNWVDFPTKPSDLPVVELQVRRFFARGWVGAILVEPVQARGGINVPPPGFLPLLRKLCDEHKALLIVDEIYTGFGRTGKWFACEHANVVPDIICLGKALTGGFPLSACVGRADVMDAAWPASHGEAIHTSTFLGHPVGCAMALAQMAELERQKLVERSATLGASLLSQLESLRVPNSALRVSSRGLGLMAGLELRRADNSPATAETITAIKKLLRRGYIILPEGEHSNVIGFTPPLTVSVEQLAEVVTVLGEVLTADKPG